MKYTTNFFNSIKSNTVNTTAELTYDELAELLATCTQTDNRDLVGLFNLCKYKTEGFRPAERKIYVNGQDTGEREIKYANGKPIIGRYAENVVEVHGLVLDYDGNGAKLDDFRKMFEPFKHFGYTSYNHFVKGVDKFRFVFPFSTPCPIAEWNRRKEDMLAFATPLVDQSTCDVSRMFYTPCCPMNAVDKFQWFEQDGVYLDWECFNASTHSPMPAITQYEPIGDTELGEVLDELRKHIAAPAYDVRFKLSRAVAKLIGKEKAIQEMRARWPDHNWNGKYEDMLSAPNRADCPGLGSIIHLIRQHNPDYTTKPAISKTDRYGFTKLSRAAFL